MFGDRLKSYPVCSNCMNKLTAAAARKAQDKAELPCDTDIEYDEDDYTPGLIEDE